jgi:hypothetical protein
MAQGFIRGPLDMRLLILYILARTIQPIDMATLFDLSLCDEGVDYFQFTEALSSLKNTGHVQEVQEEGVPLLAITTKGRANGAICEDELAYSVRLRCDRSVGELNKALQRKNQVRAKILPREDDNGVTVRMILDDDTGNIMTLDMLAPDHKQGQLLADSFRNKADQLYDILLSTLLDSKKD